MMPFDIFNGTITDSNRVDISLWHALYGNLRASRIFGSTDIPDAATVNNSINSFNNYTNGTTAIPLLLMNYSALNENAVQQNLFTVSNNQIFDVPGRTQSPYLQRLLFAAAPSIGVSNNGSITVLFRSELFYTNTGKTISNLQVDFNDGQGYRTINLNTPFTKTYTDTGYKRWKIKLNCTDASSYQCYAEFYVKRISSTGIAGRYSDGPPDDVETFNAVPGVHSGATVSVRFSRRGTERTLNKPLVIVEGYDASNVAPLIRTDPYNFERFLFDLENEPSTSYDFSEALDINAGYDLVFIDFNNGTDDILRNAALVQQVLNWVNTTKAGNPNPEQNVVMGISMGGLVARYALAQMTKNPAQFPLGTQTRLFVSFDSPHRGANVPLSVQYLLQMLVNFTVGNMNLGQVPVIQQANALVQEMASQQMLIWRATGANTFTANTFLDGVYRNMITFNINHPQPAYRFIAVSNGSECGVSTLSPYSNLIDAQDRFVFNRPWIVRRSRVSVELNLKALPNGGAPQRIAYLKFTARIRLFFGFINLLVNNFPEFLNSNSPANTLPWDGVPGGTQGIRSNLPNNFPVQTGPVNMFIILNELGVSGTLSGNNFLADNFCFVPIASALDITTINSASLTATYVSGVSPSNPSRSANFIAQEQPSASNNNLPNNIDHPRFTERNARWLYNEMENITPNTFNCSVNCQPSGFTITGDNALCTFKTYSFNQLPAHGTINWSVVPLGYAALTVNPDRSVTLAKQQNGTVTLTATATICGQTYTQTKQIAIGAPEAPSISPINFDASCGTFAEAYSTIPSGTTGHLWNLNYGQTIVDKDNVGSNYFYINPFVNTPETGQTYYNYLSVQAKNACGLSDPSAIVSMTVGSVPSNCGGGGGPIMLRVSPNPTGSSANVEALLNTSFIKLKVIDKFGNLKKEWNYPSKTKKALLNFNTLPQGIYFLKAFDGVIWRTVSFIKL